MLQITLTDVIAIYGAIVATIVLAMDYYRNRVSIKTDLILTIRGEDEDYATGLTINIMNRSRLPVYVSQIDFEYPLRVFTLWGFIRHSLRYKILSRSYGWCVALNKEISHFTPNTPFVIEAQNAFTVFIPRRPFDAMVERSSKKYFRCVVSDAQWRRSYSANFSFSDPS